MNMTIPTPKEKVFHTSGKKIEVEIIFESEPTLERGYVPTCYLYINSDDRTQDAASSLDCAKDQGGLERYDNGQIVRIPMSIINRIEEWAVENGY
tara:strand:+ start:362 stop:646 length:285 start_codon:yes stop_codon:yes gene_type:complete